MSNAKTTRHNERATFRLGPYCNKYVHGYIPKSNISCLEQLIEIAPHYNIHNVRGWWSPRTTNRKQKYNVCCITTEPLVCRRMLQLTNAKDGLICVISRSGAKLINRQWIVKSRVFKGNV